MTRATAVACANIAFVKYWGHVDAERRVPANPSISMNLDCLSTTTTVAFEEDLAEDELTINATPADRGATQRVSAHLDRIRELCQVRCCARVASRNTFPTGAGMASSASAFAALTVAAAAALELSLDEGTLASLARLGSGSASRSIPAGFVEWTVGPDGGVSHVRSVAPPKYWDLCDCIAVVSAAHKRVGSVEGHRGAPSSPLYKARVDRAASLVDASRQAILARDLAALGDVMETDAIMMHAVAMTSRPPIYYWTPDTVRVVRAVVTWRVEGLPVYYTIDAGPNVHCVCEHTYRDELVHHLGTLLGVEQVLTACPGGGTHLVPDHLI